MSDKYVNETGLTVIRDWANGKFALDADLDTLDAKVDEIIAEGGEPNVIETVKVNGTALVPVSKAVDVTVPTKVSDLTNDGDGTQGSAFATEDYVDQNGGKIDSISVNGTPQTIDANKNVDLDIPDGAFVAVFQQTSKADIDAAITANQPIYIDISQEGHIVPAIYINKGVSNTVLGCYWIRSESSVSLAQQEVQVYSITSAGWQQDSSYILRIPKTSDIPADLSDLTNTGNDPYQTESDVNSAISTAVASAYRYKGSVATYQDLPASGNVIGDVWDVQTDGMNYAWKGTGWDSLGPYVDTSVLWTSTAGQNNSLIAMTTAEINTILNASA